MISVPAAARRGGLRDVLLRRGVCGVVLVAIAVIVLGACAHLRWDTPLRARARLNLPAREFRVVMGAGAEDGNALHVGAIGDDGNSVQTHALDRLRAGDYPILRYRFDGFPRTLELALIFRRADRPEDLHAVSVPWPGSGWRTVDLRGIGEWRGEIIEIGFAEYATAQLVPPSAGFRPFRFDGTELCSLSWQGGLAALRASWFGYRPWALMSISALVPDRGTSGASSPLLAFVAMIALGLLAMARVLHWSRRQLLAYVASVAAALWVALDARWLDDLNARHASAERVYAGKPWSERQRLQPDESVAMVAEQVRSWLSGDVASQRLLVEADSEYVFLRLCYLLLPRNVGLLDKLDGVRPPPDSLILLYASSHWVYDAGAGLLRGSADVYPVDPVYTGAGVSLYRVRRSSR